MKKIPIKTERDVEHRLEVKTERKSSGQDELKSSLNSWKEEKQAFVQKIVALKADNHQNLLLQMKAKAEFDTMALSKQKLEKKLLDKEAEFAMAMKKFDLEISKAKKELDEMKIKNDKIISDLKRENQLLTARIKQYQTGMQQKSFFENQMDRANMEYEVEAILNHRITANGRHYLIRWKGYGSDEDTWEKETNLSCPKMLKSYIKSAGLNTK